MEKKEEESNPATSSQLLSDHLLLRAEHVFHNFILENSSIVFAGTFQADFILSKSSLARLQHHPERWFLQWEVFSSFCCVSPSEVFISTVCKC